MKRLFLKEILENIGGEVVQGEGNPLIKDVVTKPYKVHSNTMLIDLYTKSVVKGRYFTRSQDTVVITEKPEDFSFLGEGVIVVKVTDIDQAYWDFVDFYRSLFSIPIIGVTGTCGKTTTKELIKHIFEKRFKVQATYKSFNGGQRNHRYLLGIDDHTGAVVMEMGVDRPGDIIFYIKYFLPRIRILLNIDVYHLVGCKTPEAYLAAKAELLHDFDPVNGVLILNADDENIKKIDVSKFQKNIIYFGLSDNCQFKATNITYGQEGMNFTLQHQQQEYQVKVPGYGKHNVYNALAAIAATWSAGIDLEEACERVGTFNQVVEHLEIREGLRGSTIIDDTWNAAPLSMANALQVLREIAAMKNKIAILGYMPQLGEGEFAEQEYRKVGEKVVENKIDLLLVVGEQAKGIGLRALELGMDVTKVCFCETGTEVYQILEPILSEHCLVLLKVPHRVMVQDSFKEFKNKLILPGDGGSL